MPSVEIVCAFGMPGGPEWIIILVIALLLFGRRLPEIMRSLGGSVREFKKGIDDGVDTKPTPPANDAPAGAISRDQPADQPPADQHHPKP